MELLTPEMLRNERQALPPRLSRQTRAERELDLRAAQLDAREDWLRAREAVQMERVKLLAWWALVLVVFTAGTHGPLLIGFLWGLVRPLFGLPPIR